MNNRELYNQYFELFKLYAPEKFRMYGDGAYDTGKPNGIASSLESLLIFASRVGRNSHILNAGAGASSWMLHKWFGVKVWHCDPDMEYLDWVVRFCLNTGLGLKMPLRSQEIPSEKFDYAYYDYGTKERIPNLPSAWARTRVAMYVDDCDKRPCCSELREFVAKWTYDSNIEMIDCPYAEDEYGRWGVWLVR